MIKSDILGQFVKTDDNLVNIDDISVVDLSMLEKKYQVKIQTKNGLSMIATDLNAIELVMQIRPSALEGKKLLYGKFVWYIHNLIGHPVMQLLAFFRLYKLAFWIHDNTVPKPLGFKKKS